MSVNKIKLREARANVESLDKKIITLFAKRFVITRKIQNLKMRLGLPLSQKEREKELLKRYFSLATKKKVPKSFIKKVFTVIFSYSKKSGIIKR